MKRRRVGLGWDEGNVSCVLQVVEVECGVVASIRMGMRRKEE